MPERTRKAALAQRVAEGARRHLLCLELDSTTTPAHPGDSILSNGKVVGTVTSAGWGHRVSKNLAYAFVDSDCADDLTALVLGNEIPARRLDGPLYENRAFKAS